MEIFIYLFIDVFLKCHLFPTPYSQIDFQYLFHKFSSHFSSIQVAMSFNIFIQMELKFPKNQFIFFINQ
jgi:hypothetical protein